MKREDFLYANIAAAIAAQIKSGTWKTGDRLPSLRTVCTEYGVSLNTAIRAYIELERSALIRSQPKSGYTVSYRSPQRRERQEEDAAAPADMSDSDLIDAVYGRIDDPSTVRFSLGVPEDSLLPIAKLNKEMIEAMRSLQGCGTRYASTQGSRNLRRNIARFTYSWAGELTEEEIVTACGATDAIILALSALTRPGQTLAVESPVYFGVLRAAGALGLRVLELPADPVTGVDPRTLARILPQIDACLLISDFNNPTGSLMPDEHKQAIVDMVSARDIPLIEDDLYGDLFFGAARPRPLKAFDRTGNVLWCGSVSKTLAPGYRVGWIAPGKYLKAVLRQKHIYRISTPSLNEEAVARFMENDRYENHLRSLRGELHATSRHFMRTIRERFPAGTAAVTPQGGFMMWVELGEDVDTSELYGRALRHGISIAPGRMFTLQNKYRNCMRLSYGWRWSPMIEKSLTTLADIVSGRL